MNGKIKLTLSLVTALCFQVGCESSSKATVLNPDPYSKLYISSVNALSNLRPEEVIEVGFSKVYPASTENAWKACLTILCQYDQVLFVLPDEQLVVASHSSPFTNLKEKNSQVEYISAVLAVLVKSRAQGTSATVYTAWLSPENLKPLPIPDFRADGQKVMQELSVSDARKFMVYNLAHRFHLQLATQLFRPKDWVQKFGSKKME